MADGAKRVQKHRDKMKAAGFKPVTIWVPDVNAPGFKEIIVHPHLDSRMPAARAEYESVYGKIVSDWKGSSDGPFSLHLVIPANASAKVFLPARTGSRVTERGKPVESKLQDGTALVNVGSGTYDFNVK